MMVRHELLLTILQSSFSYASPQVNRWLEKRALVTPNNLPSGWKYQGCYKYVFSMPNAVP